jgi:hypothetical protein
MSGSWRRNRISDAAVPQLETVPEEDDVEEDTGDFGELFS